MHAPLDWHLTKDDILLYYSKDKLDTLVKKYAIDRTKLTVLPPNFSASFDTKDETKTLGVAASLIGKREKTVREFLSDVGKKMQENGQLFFEPSLRRDGFALVRVIAKCGTMWPWEGNEEQFHHVVWWIGKTANSTILVYGNLANYLDDGSAQQCAEKTKSTWWPSIHGGYNKLIKAMSHNALSPDWEEFSEEIKLTSIDGLYETCFNDGVEGRAPYLHKEKILEMLLRIDNIDDSSGRSMLCGSPLWVKEVVKPVPGIYYTGQHCCVPPSYPSCLWNTETLKSFAVAEWTGNSWRNPRWLPVYYPSSAPLCPSDQLCTPDSSYVPSVDDIYSL